MPDLLTPQTIASAGPLLLDTLLKHFLSRKSLIARSKARGDDLMYDEAFVLMKTFLESSTKYPVAALQKFGQVRTPAPPTVAVHHITIPHRSLALAAEYLVKAFGGEEMAYKIAGGSKWWQVRAGAGVEAEWIVMKKDYKVWEKGEKERERKQGMKKESGSGRGSVSAPTSAQASGSETPRKTEKEQADPVEEVEAEQGDDDAGWRNEMDETRCMLYIHGGAYYWGSINTHRYTIWRYARKMRGRCFAVNYRKAPQYPFPCAIQDCLAAYIYLTRPPPGAKHKPVKPEHMIIAGDSAGGGLVLALLQILRDTEGLELPAGAVLISPWSDLTHSFPSILHNTSTDIVPPYSFIHKPSSLWPPPPPDLTNIVQSRLKSKIKEFTAHLHSEHHSSSPTSSSNSAEDESANPVLNIPLTGQPANLSEKLRSSQPGAQKKKFSFLNFGKTEPVLHPTTHHGDTEHQPLPSGESTRNPSRVNPADAFSKLLPRSPQIGTVKGEEGEVDRRNTTLAKMDFPMELDVRGEQVMIDTQVQLYATNAQLCYPLVSPVLGYMGGLCPLYICAGDNEVLRDEIIYLAHKAANPDKYPIRDDVKAMMPHYEGIESKYGPTMVHLQVFDGTGHDLPLFSMCKSARGVFRAISTFARYVTPSAGIMPTSTTTNNNSRNGSFGKSILTPLSGLSRRNSKIVTGVKKVDSQSTSQTSSPGISMVDLGLGAEVPTSTEVNVSSPPLSPRLDLSGRKISGSAKNVELGRVESPLPISNSHTPPTPLSPASRPVPLRSTSQVSSVSQSPIDERPEHIFSIQTENIAPVDNPVVMSPYPLSPRSRPVTGRSISQLSTTSLNLHDERTEHVHGSTNTPASGGPGVSWDDGDAGPRWGGFEDDNNSAKPGEAGHPDIYRGAEAFKDNMIRERVSIQGVLRPLEPISELGAMTMPSDEIGVIKEGPAMRYLTGQYLWDKRYKRARKEVAKHREKNLREARSKDGERIGRGVKGRFEEHRARHHEKGREEGDAVGEGKEGEEEEDEGDEHWSWGWGWALDGEVPPPSAIVSRRDTTEARKLALMADRLDSTHTHNNIGGLSIWVGLANFFSNVGEKEKASEALKEAKERRKNEGRRGSDDSVGEATDGAETDVEISERSGSVDAAGMVDEQGVKRRDSVMGRLGHAFGMK